MFDVVFVFFLFLVMVTCLVYYLPPSQHTIASYPRHDCKFIVDDDPDIDSRNLNKSSIASSTSFEYQIEGDSGYAQANPNPNPNRNPHSYSHSHSHLHSKRNQISQIWDRPYHHQYWNRCLNKEQTKSHPFNTNKKMKVHATNSAHDVDIQLNMINEKSESNGILEQRIAAELDNPPSFCYIKAKYGEIKNITGPIQSV